MDILTAISWVNIVWSEVPSNVIKKCWDHTGILLSGDISSRRVAIDNIVDADDESELESHILSLVPVRAMMSVSELVNPEGEDDCLQGLDNYLCDGVSREEMENAGTSDDDLPLPGAKEQLRAIALTKRICESNRGGSGALFRALRIIQAKVREQVREGQVQTRIDSFFK